MAKEETIKIYKNEALSLADVSNSARYIIIQGSISGHCYFDYTIVDTKEGKDTCGDWENLICETFDKEDAIKICTALNKHYC